jgi:IS5 family transposase
MDQVVPWEKLCTIIEPYHKEPQTGRKPIAIERKLRILCLQQWYNLSDPGVEDAIYDRNSFQKFLSIDILTESVPDETTVCNFRNLLHQHGLFEEIFSAINKHLEKQGLLMKEGTAVDATLISAPSSTKNQSGKRDPEMSSTQKNGEWHFGMKAHVGVDPRSGLVHSLSGTTAKVHDTKQFDELLHGDEKIIFGDKGYSSKARKKALRKKGIFCGILDKGCRHSSISRSQIKRNRKLSVARAIVEHPFQVIKCQWNYRKTRYRGIAKNTGQLHLLFGLYNLFRVRKKLLFNPA